MRGYTLMHLYQIKCVPIYVFNIFCVPERAVSELWHCTIDVDDNEP